MIETKGCPICGYEGIDAFDSHGCSTFEICSCCGCESGYEYNENSTDERITELRKEWRIGRDGSWWCKRTKPEKDWDPDIQMKRAGIEL
ncbi:hypothetical protein [Pelagicoccus albus]|uniref:Uncharacterized protein n=1 Tax=Pelagicoccus albus TaxID=415222 RepID=A0A7X1E7Y5_9BACT|nr:hypothetical protein [Pelagicoccus albus]MBC2605749.1 hypothetical protein [Pelagicoccus albus]